MDSLWALPQISSFVFCFCRKDTFEIEGEICGSLVIVRLYQKFADAAIEPKMTNVFFVLQSRFFGDKQC